jgi:BlaI family penicillinase repressor
MPPGWPALKPFGLHAPAEADFIQSSKSGAANGWNRCAENKRSPALSNSARLLHFAKLRVTLSNVTLSNRLTRPLTELQQAVLDFVWSKGSATAEEVREKLRPDHPLKDSSVRTILRRLESRGYITHRLEGQSFVYEAKTSARTVAVRAVRHLIERFWEGSAELFVAGMVDAKVLSAEALQRLAKKVKASK